jgi:hypothetical protein
VRRFLNNLYLCLLHRKATHCKESCKQFEAGPRISNATIERILAKAKARKDGKVYDDKLFGVIPMRVMWWVGKNKSGVLSFDVRRLAIGFRLSEGPRFSIGERHDHFEIYFGPFTLTVLDKVLQPTEPGKETVCQK